MWPKYEILTPQAVGSSTFTPAPLDAQLTMPEVWDYNGTTNAAHANYVYVDPKTDEPVYLTWGKTVPAAYRAGHIALNAPGVKDAKEKPKFALLGVTDTITYATVAIGVIRAGFEIFLLSPRTSPQVLAHLLRKQGSTHIFVSPDAATQALIKEAQVVLGKELVVLPVPSFEELYSETPVEAPPKFRPDLDELAIILHSSGSTSLPKVVPYPHRALILLGILPYHSQYDHCTNVAWHVPPMFHLLGVGQLSITAFSGATISVYPPVQPPLPPTPDTALGHAVKTNCQFAIFPPILLHAFMMKAKETLPLLAKFKAIAYGGGPLNRTVGDAMVAAGVKISVVYGMTEVLATSSFIPAPSPHGWEWVHWDRALTIHYRDLGHGTAEPFIMASAHTQAWDHESEWHRNNLNNIEIDGVKGYTTSDVIVRHPTDPNAFKIIGRVDDQITLSTGEKTNPTPLEGILMTDPLIGQVITFGRGRPHGGLLIQPKPGPYFSESTTDADRAEFLDKIWPTVEKMNAYAPSFSRVMRSMVIVVQPQRPFVITQKGTPLRSEALVKYEAEIDKAYEAFEESADGVVEPPSSWEDEESVKEYVRRVVKTVIPSVEEDNADLFAFGCDSLRAAWIRNAIAHALGHEKGASLARELVYEHPTIASLSSLLVGSSTHSSSTDAKVAELEAMIAKYTASFPSPPSSSSKSSGGGVAGLIAKFTNLGTASSALAAKSSDKKVVLVTGTTGGLGSNLLALLLKDPAVEKVYAVNRAGTKALKDRHEENFKDRGLDVELLKNGKVVFLEASTSKPGLGIDAKVYDEIRTSVTHIIHNAWPVNFNYTIKTFEPAVQSVKELVDLALKAPKTPKFLFVSSVSVVRIPDATPGKPTTETYVDDASLVAGMGYGESKFVAESILKKAAESTPLRPVSVRVGQLSGGLNGNWNASDWVPAIVRSAGELKCLPDAGSEMSISWVRLDEAAQILLEMAEQTDAPVLHLVHPKPVKWESLFVTFSQQVGAPLVPYGEWLARIEQVAVDDKGAVDVAKARAIPAVRLLNFFRAIGGQSGEGIGGFTGVEELKTDEARRVSQTMRAMEPLQAADVEKWVAYWRKAGHVAA
ncbi:acetyl-CoA synthetase-like protein [Exidia glandulosa HHB12029]|uniref:Acetyl-CoA synthetase-like protein n=1 Tax=Exidia glandulosa HHB12029 TaxID=1314781 RepID=A0A165J7C8_EXIGL|nr:acetyl-CoA synthetase-like protein [Exidia glandulosa HHB12029]